MTGTETRVVWQEGHNEDKKGVGEDGRRLATGLAGAEVGGRIFPQEQCRSPEGLGMEVTGPDLPLRKLSCWLRVSLGRGGGGRCQSGKLGSCCGWGSLHACSRVVLIRMAERGRAGSCLKTNSSGLRKGSGGGGRVQNDFQAWAPAHQVGNRAFYFRAVGTGP